MNPAPANQSDPPLDIALMAFVGEKCQGCQKTFETIESLNDSVWWPWEGGRIGHKKCYDENTNAKTT